MGRGDRVPQVPEWLRYEGVREPRQKVRFPRAMQPLGKPASRRAADTITPRFRAGLTVLEGRGQWLEPTGNLQREPVRVVMGAVAADTDRSMKLVDEISAAFQARFGQDPVFRMWNPACAGIHRR